MMNECDLEDGRGPSAYCYDSASPTHAHAYLLPKVQQILDLHFGNGNDRQVFDLGCRNGFVANWLTERGYGVTGVDPSDDGIAIANSQFPNLKLRCGSAYDDLQSTYGRFPSVISLEVIEHVYAPRVFARTLASLVEPKGIAIVSTPYNGYVKNVVVALSGRFDQHVNPLWDHGHIKFWSFATLTRLLTEAGFAHVEFHRVGRIPILAKSMIAVARKSQEIH